MLCLHLVFFFSMSVQQLFQVFKFRKTHSKIFEKFLPVIFHTSKQSGKSSFLFSCSEHLMNPVFSFFSFFFFYKKVKPTSNDHILLTTIHTYDCKSGNSTLQNRRSVKLLDYSLGISGYYAEFHKGQGTVGAGEGRGMACVN